MLPPVAARLGEDGADLMLMVLGKGPAVGRMKFPERAVQLGGRKDQAPVFP